MKITNILDEVFLNKETIKFIKAALQYLYSIHDVNNISYTDKDSIQANTVFDENSFNTYFYAYLLIELDKLTPDDLNKNMLFVNLIKTKFLDNEDNFYITLECLTNFPEGTFDEDNEECMKEFDICFNIYIRLAIQRIRNIIEPVNNYM